MEQVLWDAIVSRNLGKPRVLGWELVLQYARVVWGQQSLFLQDKFRAKRIWQPSTLWSDCIRLSTAQEINI